MKVLLTAAALSDLQDIGDFIRRDNVTRADIFTRELLAACAAIAEMPLAAPVVPRYEHLDYRRKVHKRYLIIYRALADRVTVVCIAHGARDIDRLLARRAA